jgi:hypothetical protein
MRSAGSWISSGRKREARPAAVVADLIHDARGQEELEMPEHFPHNE